jgi:hypothetical protein
MPGRGGWPARKRPHPGKLVQVELVKGLVQAHPGVVDQPVDAAVPVQGGPGQPAGGRPVSDVGHHGEGAAEFLAQRFQAVRAAGGQDGMRARLIEQPGGGRADTRRCAGNDDGGAGQVRSVHPGIFAHRPGGSNAGSGGRRIRAGRGARLASWEVQSPRCRLGAAAFVDRMRGTASGRPARQGRHS